MSARQAEPIETRVGILTGWRCWFSLPDEGLLRPIYMRGLIWKPRQPFEAACPEQVHAVPAEGCKCGIWAVCHPMLLEEVQWTQAPPPGIKPLPGTLVVGQVALWGSIIEHERGWRAQFAYPSQLYVLSENTLLAQALRERYLVPVASGPEAAVLEQVLPPSLRNLRRARAGSPEAKRAAFSDVPTVPCPVPTVVELVHAQERKALERARERVELARNALRLEEERIAAERQALELERSRDETRRQQHGIANAGAMASLKRRLVEHGIKQSDVAERAGVSREQICNTLAGRGVSRPVVEAAEALLREKASADPHAQNGVPTPNHSGRPRRLRAVPSPGEPEIT